MIYGDPDRVEVETVNVENFNGIFRERLGQARQKDESAFRKRSSVCIAP